MNIQEIRNRYAKMVSTIEDAGIYDGRGTFDLYQCEKCSREKITTYADKGVTPFIIGCSCGGNMQHTKTLSLFQITFEYSNGKDQLSNRQLSYLMGKSNMSLMAG